MNRHWPCKLICFRSGLPFQYGLLETDPGPDRLKLALPDTRVAKGLLMPTVHHHTARSSDLQFGNPRGRMWSFRFFRIIETHSSTGNFTFVFLKSGSLQL